MNNEKKIYVIADFDSINEVLIGILYVEQVRGKEFYSFEYDLNWLKKYNILLDPDLELYKGRQYINDDKHVFGFFADSCPDRWGRKLMDRQEMLKAKASEIKPKKLLESDYLLGVYDQSRMGGLRFKTDIDGDYLSNSIEYATPPWTSLRDLEYASIMFESNENNQDSKWLKQLLAPGSSLGGARPKASVMAPDGSLWIAKFPSKHDNFNSGAWEMVVHDLAAMYGLDVPEAKANNFSSLGTTYLVKRFDRNGKNRVHFSSAMTMLKKKDGDDASEGSSYLDIVSFIKSNGSHPHHDLLELYKRVLFYIGVSNTDDHLRNHGFLLDNDGWRLSPMYDVNPNIYGDYLSLNIDNVSSLADFDLAISAAPYYDVNNETAKALVSDLKLIIRDNWEKLAKKYGIHQNEIERMKPAFKQALN